MPSQRRTPRPPCTADNPPCPRLAGIHQYEWNSSRDTRHTCSDLVMAGESLPTAHNRANGVVSTMRVVSYHQACASHLERMQWTRSPPPQPHSVPWGCRGTREHLAPAGSDQQGRAGTRPGLHPADTAPERTHQCSRGLFRLQRRRTDPRRSALEWNRPTRSGAPGDTSRSQRLKQGCSSWRRCQLCTVPQWACCGGTVQMWGRGKSKHDFDV